MLGCTNYKADGTGCNYSIFEENFSDSWDKISQNKRNYDKKGRKLPLDKCVLLGQPIIDLLKIIKYVTFKLSEENNFKFNTKSLGKFLIGSKEKAFLSFHLDENKTFGCIDKKYENQIYNVINVLIDFGFLNVDEMNYRSVSYSQRPIDEEFARTIFEQFVK